jgi:hypothetical protein
MFNDILEWGMRNGLCGIRPWAADLLGYWEPMALFRYDSETKKANAKPALLQLRNVF